MLLALWSPKGGSGTSVVAAALALVLADRNSTSMPHGTVPVEYRLSLTAYLLHL